MSRKGVTAMKHARAWVAQRYPGALTLEAYAKIVWIPEAQTPYEKFLNKPVRRRPISLQEDLFGVFDLIVFPSAAMQGYENRLLQLVQVTTIGADGKDAQGAVSHRKRKVREWAEELGELPDWVGRILILAWVPRKHFRMWVWDPDEGWQEGPPETAPLPRKQPVKASSELQPSS